MHTRAACLVSRLSKGQADGEKEVVRVSLSGDKWICEESLVHQESVCCAVPDPLISPCSAGVPVVSADRWTADPGKETRLQLIVRRERLQSGCTCYRFEWQSLSRHLFLAFLSFCSPIASRAI